MKSNIKTNIIKVHRITSISLALICWFSTTAHAQAKTTQPQPISMIMPTYPREFRDSLKEGEVVLEIVVKADGSVGSMETIRSDDEAFSKAALEAVAAWKFKPAEKNGEAVDVRVRVPIPFKITSLVFNPKELAQAPKPISQPAPAFPQTLRKAGIEGVVLLMFHVRPDGTTAKISVIKSDHPGFNEPAIDAVRKWRFKPGMKNGRAVTTRVRIPIPFRIR